MFNRFNGFRQYLAANTDQTTYVLAAGHTSTFGAADVSVIGLGDARGFTVRFFGSDDADVASAFKLWLVSTPTDLLGTENQTKLDDFTLTLFGSGTFTLGTSTVLGLTDNLYADTVTFTLAASPDGPGTVLTDTYELGTPAAYSPANNTIGELIIPNWPAQAMVIEFDVGAGSANAFVERTR